MLAVAGAAAGSARGAPQPTIGSVAAGSSAPGAGWTRITMPRSTSGGRPPRPSTRTWNRGSRANGLPLPRNSVTAATITSLPGRPAASGSSCNSTGSAPSSSSIAWSQMRASSVALGTKSDTPVWLVPYDPGMIVSVPD